MSRHQHKLPVIALNLPFRVQMKGKHPGPNVELKFWTDRSRDLTSISAQLVAEESNRVRKVLEAARSSYLPIVCR